MQILFLNTQGHQDHNCFWYFELRELRSLNDIRFFRISFPAKDYNFFFITGVLSRQKGE